MRRINILPKKKTICANRIKVKRTIGRITESTYGQQREHLASFKTQLA